MYSQGVCRIRKPACAGNGCAIFPIFQTADWEQKIRRSAADDLFRVFLQLVENGLALRKGTHITEDILENIAGPEGVLPHPAAVVGIGTHGDNFPSQLPEAAENIC